MKTERAVIWENGEYTWPQGFGFVPFLTAFIHEETKQERPCVLVVPGGAYYIVSPTESTNVAMSFYEKGYNTFVLTYTTNLLAAVPLKAQPMKDLSRAIRYIRKHAERYGIDTEKIAVCGFSAGGHLTASVGVHYMDIAEENPEYAEFSNRPDALILSYPVIASDSYTHKGSMSNLLGFYDSEDAKPSNQMLPGCKTPQEEASYMNLYQWVNEKTPPAFLWHTVTDEAVPVENSLLFAQACRNNGVTHALHLFSHGPHGLSIATKEWQNGLYGELYTLEPFEKTLAAIKRQEAIADKERIKTLEQEFAKNAPGNPCGRKANPEAAVWPCLADGFLQQLFTG